MFDEAVLELSDRSSKSGRALAATGGKEYQLATMGSKPSWNLRAVSACMEYLVPSTEY